MSFLVPNAAKPYMAARGKFRGMDPVTSKLAALAAKVLMLLSKLMPVPGLLPFQVWIRSRLMLLAHHKLLTQAAHCALPV